MKAMREVLLELKSKVDLMLIWVGSGLNLVGFVDSMGFEGPEDDQMVSLLYLWCRWADCWLVFKWVTNEKGEKVVGSGLVKGPKWVWRINLKK